MPTQGHRLRNPCPPQSGVQSGGPPGSTQHGWLLSTAAADPAVPLHMPMPPTFPSTPISTQHHTLKIHYTFGFAPRPFDVHPLYPVPRVPPSLHFPTCSSDIYFQLRVRFTVTVTVRVWC